MRMTSTGSSGSSQVTLRGSSHGVPMRCWCGQNVVTFVSKTSENPYRRFHRCEIALKRRNEHHLFTWVDEALLQEIRLINAKHQRLVEDVNDVKKRMMKEMEIGNNIVKQMEEGVMSSVIEKIDKELCLAKLEMEKMGKEMTWSIVKKICVILVTCSSFSH